MAKNGFISMSIRQETVEILNSLVNKDDRNIDSAPKVVDVLAREKRVLCKNPLLCKNTANCVKNHTLITQRRRKVKIKKQVKKKE